MRKRLVLMICALGVLLLCACSWEEAESSAQTDDLVTVTTIASENTAIPETTVGEKQLLEFTDGDQWVYMNLQDLTNHADWIVRGTVIEQRYEWQPVILSEPDDLQIMFTVTTLQIEEIYKGEITHKTIDVLSRGREADTTIYRYGKHYADFDIGSSYVVFMKTTVSDDHIGILMAYNQGRYLIEDGLLKPDWSGPFQGLDFTISELKNLLEQ